MVAVENRNNLISGLVSGLGISGLVVRLLDQFGQSGQHTGDFLGHGRRSGQVVTLGLESVLISDPGEGDFLAFRGNPVGRSLVGVAHTGVVILAVSVASVRADVLLGLGFLAGGAVGTSVAKLLKIAHN